MDKIIKTSVPVFFFLLVSIHFATAQVGLHTVQVPKATEQVKINALHLSNPTTLTTNSQNSTQHLPALHTFFRESDVSSQRFSAPNQESAFFCRLEVKLENATQMPVRFRLGSTQYVDYLEGKFEGWRYGY